MVYARSIVECISFIAFFGNNTIWSPDIGSVEKVQRRFTKRLSSLKHLSYDIRLAKLGLPTLELRRLHLDVIFCNKVIFRLASVNFDDFFTLRTVSTTRGHKYKLYTSQCSCNVRQSF